MVTREYLEKALQDGNEASQLLQNPAFRRVVETLQKEYFEFWKGATDVASREKVHAAVMALDDIISGLRAMEATGWQALQEEQRYGGVDEENVADDWSEV